MPDAVTAVALLIAASLSAVPAKIAVAPLSGRNMDEDALEDLSRKLASALEKEGFTVVSPQTTAAALGTEPVSDENLPSLARALAVDMVAVGSIDRSGKDHVVELRVMNGADAQLLAQHSRKVRSSAGVQAELKRAARSVSTVVLKAPDRPLITTETEDAPSTVRSYAWLPALGGIALAGAGTYFLLQTQDAADELRHRQLEGSRISTVADYGQQSESLAWGSFMLAAGAMGAAAAMYFLAPSEEDEVSISVGVTPNGAAAALRWELP